MSYQCLYTCMDTTRRIRLSCCADDERETSTRWESVREQKEHDETFR